jgi:hypothetical protein
MSAVQQFIGLTGCSSDVAQTFLAQADGNFEAAVTFYFNNMEQAASMEQDIRTVNGEGSDGSSNSGGSSRVSTNRTSTPIMTEQEEIEEIARAVRLSLAEPPRSSSRPSRPPPAPAPASYLTRDTSSNNNNNSSRPVPAPRGLHPPSGRRPPPRRAASMEEKDADGFTSVRRSSTITQRDVPDIPPVPITGVALEFGEQLLQYGSYLTELGSRILEQPAPQLPIK